MPKNNSAGANIRKLAQQRFISAFWRYAAIAGILVAMLLLRTSGFSSFTLLLYPSGIGAIAYLYVDAKNLVKRAGDASRGAAAEVKVAELLAPLVSRRWQIEYNFRIKYYGDADVVIKSPRGNWFVVDVKSHKGTKVYENGSLRRRYGKNTYDFSEGDLIAKVKGQAVQVGKLKGIGKIIPILCFTESNVDISGNKADSAYIVTADNLIKILLFLDS